MIQKRVPGSSLVEVIVSMIIISIVFGVAVMVILSVTKHSFSFTKLKYEHILHQEATRLEKEFRNVSEEYSIDNVRIITSMEQVDGKEQLYKLRMVAVSHDSTKLAEIKKIIYAPLR